MVEDNPQSGSGKSIQRVCSIEHIQLSPTFWYMQMSSSSLQMRSTWSLKGIYIIAPCVPWNKLKCPLCMQPSQPKGDRNPGSIWRKIAGCPLCAANSWEGEGCGSKIKDWKNQYICEYKTHVPPYPWSQQKQSMLPTMRDVTSWTCRLMQVG